MEKNKEKDFTIVIMPDGVVVRVKSREDLIRAAEDARECQKRLKEIIRG